MPPFWKDFGPEGADDGNCPFMFAVFRIPKVVFGLPRAPDIILASGFIRLNFQGLDLCFGVT